MQINIKISNNEKCVMADEEALRVKNVALNQALLTGLKYLATL